MDANMGETVAKHKKQGGYRDIVPPHNCSWCEFYERGHWNDSPTYCVFLEPIKFQTDENSVCDYLEVRDEIQTRR